jgi:hypothetical protein
MLAAVLRRSLGVLLLAAPSLVLAQQLTDSSAVLVLTGQRATGQYHDASCPVVAGHSDVVKFTVRDAQARYYQPHCLCIAGHDDPPPCKPRAATTPNAAAVTAAGVARTGRPSLIGLTAQQIAAQLGLPSSSATDVAYYDTKAGTLRVYFKNGVVSDTQPANFDLSVFPGLAISQAATGGAAAAKPSTGSGSYTNSDGQRVQSPTRAATPPAGATAQCRDGTYSFSRNRSGTCSGHGGVARWL